MIRAWWRRANLRSRVRVAYLAVGLLGALSLLSMALSFGHVLDARVRLVDHLDPGIQASRKWISSVVDQEAGIRGYVLSGDESFLAPDDAAIEAAAVGQRSARRLLGDEPHLLAIMDQFDRDEISWRTKVAEPLVARVRAGGPDAITTKDLARSKDVFDALRVEYRALQDSIEVERAAARDELDQQTTNLFTITAVSIALLTIGFAVNWRALNRWVVDPIDRLSADAREVTSGSLAHPIQSTGPPDLRNLGRDVEAMRERIVDELAAVELSRAQLELQAADLTRSNQELEQFAYVASHDLQEPLRKITGFCQLLQRRYADQLDDRADEYIAYAVDGAKRMQLLINDLLAFSRVGRTTDKFRPVDLGAVAEIVRSTLEPAIAEAGATVQIHELPIVPGDAALLEALLQNLVANAIKFRGDDPPVVDITATASDRGWELACSDNGIGIEPQYAERVFVIFQRLNSRDAYEGTGIGLAMCRKIVEFHGGRMWIDPDPGHAGTIVRWTMLREAVPNEQSGAEGRV